MIHKPRSLFVLALAASGLFAACSGGDGDSITEPFATSRSFSVELPTTAVDSANPTKVAHAGALIDELVDEIEGEVGDIDELLAATSGNCRDGGSVTVSESTSAGVLTRQLAYSSCQSDDDETDGVVTVSCVASNCRATGTLTFGSGEEGYVEQSLDSDDRRALLLKGNVEYANYSDASDTGDLLINVRFELSGPNGTLGAAQLDDFHYSAVATAAGHTSLSYEGGYAATALSLSSTCDASGSGIWSTTTALDDNDSADRIDTGTLSVSSSGTATLAWNAGALTVTASDGNTLSFSKRDFDALCDL